MSLKTKYEDEDVIAHVDELLEELSSLPDLGEHQTSYIITLSEM